MKGQLATLLNRITCYRFLNSSLYSILLYNNKEPVRADVRDVTYLPVEHAIVVTGLAHRSRQWLGTEQPARVCTVDLHCPPRRSAWTKTKSTFCQAHGGTSSLSFHREQRGLSSEQALSLLRYSSLPFLRTL
ncbi:hypothetical protein J6590_036285 [Homalodisca vitripennis]|nr:hypothetical protein J6590_036285 [Homalodisca vitripennis]